MNSAMAGDVIIGSATTFDDGAAGTPNGQWNNYTASGIVPVGADTVFITVANSAAAGQAGTNDGYVDLVTFSTTVVPEPSSTALLGLGGLALILRRRK